MNVGDKVAVCPLATQRRILASWAGRIGRITRIGNKLSQYNFQVALEFPEISPHASIVVWVADIHLQLLAEKKCNFCEKLVPEQCYGHCNWLS